MFCGNCGKKLIDGSLFCMECGTPVPVGRFAGTPSAAQQPSAFSGNDNYVNAENSYSAPNEADLFGTNSFSEEEISAFSGAMNAFGAQGFQVPTVEDVDLSTGRVRQKAPKNKDDDILLENFSMTEGKEDTEIISKDLPVIEGCSMEEDESKDVVLDPYRFLGDSMEDMSMDAESTEMPTALMESVSPVSPISPLSVEPVSFSAVSPEDNFANLAAEPDIQPSVTVEPVFPRQEQNAVLPAAEETAAEPVAEKAEEPAAEQIAKPVAEQAAEPVIEQVVVSAVEQVAVAVVEQEAVPVVEQIAEPVVEQAAEPVIEQAAEPVIEQAAEPVIEQVTEPVVEQAAVPVIEQAAVPVIEQVAPPVIEQAAVPVIEQAAVPVIEQVEEPVVKPYVPPVAEPPVIQQQEYPQQQPKQQPSSYEPPPAPQKKGVPIWLFILVLLGLIAAVVIILLNNMNN